MNQSNPSNPANLTPEDQNFMVNVMELMIRVASGEVPPMPGLTATETLAKLSDMLHLLFCPSCVAGLSHAPLDTRAPAPKRASMIEEMPAHLDGFISTFTKGVAS